MHDLRPFGSSRNGQNAQDVAEQPEFAASNAQSEQVVRMPDVLRDVLAQHHRPRVAVIIGEETASVKPGAKTSAAHSQQDEVASQALKIPHVFGVVQELFPQARKCKSGCVSWRAT